MADCLVVEAFRASAVVADVVGAPAGAEFVAAGGELADEVVQVLVMRVAAGFGPQDGDGDVGGLVPVGVEAAGRGVKEVKVARVGRFGCRGGGCSYVGPRR